jgi:dihydrofolate synthase/folylpolyglutamate synthase
MTYKATLDYLFRTAPMFQQIGDGAYKAGMENSFRIDRRLHSPHRNYRTLHIAGTNGKGSTAHLVASILQEAGYKVGLYTSPHLLDFRERIRVNGAMIVEAAVVDFVARHRAFFEKIRPSFFEVTTGMAFDYFARRAVDVAVIETGLGGRLDCTNVISPVLGVITNISLDHTQLLGNTVEQIAWEKAGIIKSGVPVVIGEAAGEVKAIFEKACDIPPVFADVVRPIHQAKMLPSGHWRFESDDFPALIGELGGYAQPKNAATVLCMVKELRKNGFNIPDAAVYGGFRAVTANTGLMGRWQTVRQSPRVVVDVGHNVGGMGYVVRQLKSVACERLHIIFGMVQEKDVAGVLALLPPATYYFTQANLPRAMDAQGLAAAAADFGLSGKIYPTVAAALAAALQAAGERDFVFAGGSTFIVAEILQEFFNTNSL